MFCRDYVTELKSFVFGEREYGTLEISSTQTLVYGRQYCVPLKHNSIQVAIIELALLYTNSGVEMPRTNQPIESKQP